MFEAVTVNSLMMMTSTISEASLTTDTHARTHARTHTHTHTLTHTHTQGHNFAPSIINLSRVVVSALENKNEDN